MNPGPSIIRFAEYEADLRSGELRRQGHRLKLQDKPFQVLAALLLRPGELVSREELRQSLWAADTFVDFEHGLNTAVNKVREALRDSANNPRFIETLPRRGYRERCGPSTHSRVRSCSRKWNGLPRRWRRPLGSKRMSRWITVRRRS